MVGYTDNRLYLKSGVGVGARKGALRELVEAPGNPSSELSKQAMGASTAAASGPLKLGQSG